jgi:hypothetical protein
VERNEKPECGDEHYERPKIVRIRKPIYRDFKETRDGIRQSTCECGAQAWQLWEDGVVSCNTCGLPEPTIGFHLIEPEEAEIRLEQMMK